MTFIRLILSFGLVALLTACAAPPVPRDTFYRLEVGEPAQRFAQPVIPGVVEVGRLDSDGILSERAIAYQEAPGLGIQRYRYDFWSEPPGQLVQDSLARFLERANAAERVVGPELRVPPDYVVRGRVRRFEHLIHADRVAVELQLGLVSARNGALVLMNTYATEATLPVPGAAGAAQATNMAVSEIMGRFLADLAQADFTRADIRTMSAR